MHAPLARFVCILSSKDRIGQGNNSKYEYSCWQCRGVTLSCSTSSFLLRFLWNNHLGYKAIYQDYVLRCDLTTATSRLNVTMAFASSLKQLRDFLRLPTPSQEDLTFQISATLLALHIHPTSLPPSSIPSTDLKALARYLPAVQNLLLQDVLPHFVSIFDDRSQELVRGLFVPQKKVEGLDIRRNIALVSYLTLPSYLNAPKQGQPTLSKAMRSFLLSLLDALSTEFMLDDLYYSIFPNEGRITKEGKDGVKTLQWEDALRSVVSIPAKTGNATGRWELEGDTINAPVTLLPR